MSENQLQANEIRLEDIPTFGRDALFALRAQLGQDIVAIDRQLTARRVDFQAGAWKQKEELDAYYLWRSRALGAKSIKVKMMTSVRERLRQLEEDRIADRQKFWRGWAITFKNTLLALRDSNDLGPNARNTVEEILADYEDAREA